MQFSIEKTLLLIIDVQGNLATSMQEKENLFKNIQSLIKASYHLEIPRIYTEQVPEKIGTTIPEIAQDLMGQEPIIKKTFSCCGEEVFNKKLKTMKRKQIIVCGIETHVCVYQTAYDLSQQDYEVQVVADAVSSRTISNKKLALERMKTSGITLTSTEMIITELLKTSTHSKFKDVLSLIK